MAARIATSRLPRKLTTATPTGMTAWGWVTDHSAIVSMLTGRVLDPLPLLLPPLSQARPPIRPKVLNTKVPLPVVRACRVLEVGHPSALEAG